LRVLGGVGGEVVFADAGEVEGRGVTVVLERRVSTCFQLVKGLWCIFTSMVSDELAEVWRQIRGQAYCWLVHQISVAG
jgi:hypothetical protein